LAEALLEQAGGFEILSPCRLSTLCFRYAPASIEANRLDELNRQICAELEKTGRAFLATTRLGGRTPLRYCFVNWRTTTADVEEIVSTLSAIGGRLAGL
jgi:aromatic-L-amino-acid decarboxylase